MQSLDIYVLIDFSNEILQHMIYCNFLQGNNTQNMFGQVYGNNILNGIQINLFLNFMSFMIFSM
jgi:hypothetical protein